MSLVIDSINSLQTTYKRRKIKYSYKSNLPTNQSPVLSSFAPATVDEVMTLISRNSDSTWTVSRLNFSSHVIYFPLHSQLL